MGFIGNADNIRWGYFDLVPQATGTGYDIVKVATKTNENTLYIPIANSLYMEEYKIEDLVNFLYQEADYFNNLPDGSKITHPSTLWYLERENCLAINFASTNSARLKNKNFSQYLDINKIPDTNTLGLYNTIRTTNNSDVLGIATIGEKHSEVFVLVKCAIINQNSNNFNLCTLKDSSSNIIYIIFEQGTQDKPNPNPNAFIDYSIGPVFHLDTDKECDHQFVIPYSNNAYVYAVPLPSSHPPSGFKQNVGWYPPFIVLGKKTGNAGELTISAQAKGTIMYVLGVPTYSNNTGFMKYDQNSAVQICADNKWAISFNCNSKIGGIRPINTHIMSKKFKLYYFGDVTDITKPLVFHSVFIDLEDDTTKYEVFLAGDTTFYMLSSQQVTVWPQAIVVQKYEGDITYVPSTTVDPLSIPDYSLLRVLMLTNGFLHGKKLWKYQSTNPNDFFIIYQSGSLYHGFTNPNNLQLTNGDLFEIREEIPMTICSFGPSGSTATDPVNATTIQTGYRHVYMAMEINKTAGSVDRVSQNYNYSQECIFGPYGSFNSTQNGHDFYLVKCLDLQALETIGYTANIKLTIKNLTAPTNELIGITSNKEEIRKNDSVLQTIVCNCAKDHILMWSSNNNDYYVLGSLLGSDEGCLSTNYLSQFNIYWANGNESWGVDAHYTLTERPDKLFIVASFYPVGIEIYLKKV